MSSRPLTQGQDANRRCLSLSAVSKTTAFWSNAVSLTERGPSVEAQATGRRSLEDRTSRVSEDHPADRSSPGVCISWLSFHCGEIQTTESLLPSPVSSVHPIQGHRSHSHCAAVATTHLQLPLIPRTETLCPRNNGSPLPPPPSPWQTPFYLLSL